MNIMFCLGPCLRYIWYIRHS